uniref:Uncharacterized protein n=1 Tax=Glossina austeni TaxID=7395 RepID=A0A1A9UKT2_GLOAU
MPIERKFTKTLSFLVMLNAFSFLSHNCRISDYIPLCALYLAELSARADTSLSDSEPSVSYSVIGIQLTFTLPEKGKSEGQQMIPQPPSPQESSQHVTLVELLVIICECLGCTGGLPLVYEFTMSHGKPVPILLVHRHQLTLVLKIVHQPRFDAKHVDLEQTSCKILWFACFSTSVTIITSSTRYFAYANKMIPEGEPVEALKRVYKE